MFLFDCLFVCFFASLSFPLSYICVSLCVVLSHLGFVSWVLFLCFCWFLSFTSLVSLSVYPWASVSLAPGLSVTSSQGLAFLASRFVPQEVCAQSWGVRMSSGFAWIPCRPKGQLRQGMPGRPSCVKITKHTDPPSLCHHSWTSSGELTWPHLHSWPSTCDGQKALGGSG